MRIKFTRETFAGSRTYAEGEGADLPEGQAAEWIRAGIAVPAREGERIETATAPEPPAETATVGTERKPKGK